MYMKECVSAHALRVYRLGMLRMLSSVMRGRVCVRGGSVVDESDDPFLCSNEWLYICLSIVCSAPNGDIADEMRVYVCEVHVFQGVYG